ncbi:hypothetical protein GGR55DRAFT_701613 [Xylaria sp. FL0064]|nr:hypothetical protein GGR55DRAFT_701613 [Xylaria sp. FL0064]
MARNTKPSVKRIRLPADKGNPVQQPPASPQSFVRAIVNRVTKSASETSVAAKATIPGRQSVWCEHDTIINIASPPTPDGWNGKPSEGHQVAYTGPLQAVLSEALANNSESTKARIVVQYPALEFSGRLIELLKLVYFPLSQDMPLKLMLLPSDAPMMSNQKRRIDEEDESSRSSSQPENLNKKADEAYAIDPNLCGNCGSDDHKAAVCAKLEKSGWMEACCKCDSLQHTYEHCPLRLSEEDFEYLILNRGNKAPVKCSLHLGRVVLLELGRNASPFHDYDIIELPYSSTFSRQLAGGCSALDISRDDANNAVELPRYKQPLGRAVSILRDQRWTIEDQEIDRPERPCENCYSPDHSIYQCFDWRAFAASIQVTLVGNVTTTAGTAFMCKAKSRNTG